MKLGILNMFDVFRKMVDFKLIVYIYNCWIVLEFAFQNFVYFINNFWILIDMFYIWKEYLKIFGTWNYFLLVQFFLGGNKCLL